MRKMIRVRSIEQQTHNKYLNCFQLEVEHRDGQVRPYYMASRMQSPEELKISRGLEYLDAVEIYGICRGDDGEDRMVLVRQYRAPIDDYIYELPAGLIEDGEPLIEAAVREAYEETGMTFTPIEVPEGYMRPLFAGVGLCDESISTVFGYMTGTPTNAHQEDSEDIEVILADRQECKRIMREETVALMCGYQMMHFIADTEDPFGFLKVDLNK